MSAPVSVTLLPCPFCGGETGYSAPPALGKGRWVIQCDDCRAEGPTSSDNSDAGEAEAITAWNTRTATEAATAAREAELRGALGEAADVLADLFERGDVQVLFAGNPVGCAHLEQRARTVLAKSRTAQGEVA